MKVLVIGAGNMGLTYAEGMAKSPFLNRRNLMIHDVSKEKILELSEVPHFDTYNNLDECLPQADAVFVAVKPFHSQDLFDKMKGKVNSIHR